MSYSIRLLPDAPIILVTHTMSDEYLAEQERAIPEIIALAQAQPEPVFLVIDLRDITLNLGQRIEAASMGVRGPNPLLHQPMIRETVFVSGDRMTRQGVGGLAGGALFGRPRVRQVETREEALVYCRGVLTGDPSKREH